VAKGRHAQPCRGLLKEKCHLKALARFGTSKSAKPKLHLWMQSHPEPTAAAGPKGKIYETAKTNHVDSAEKPRMVKTRHLKAPSKHPGHIRKIAHNRFQEVHILLIHLEKKLVFKNRGFFSRIHVMG
jgi:hypothetical protein